jgi:heme/copper-type cytochrome/quinol oxidase subunit 3
MSELEDHATEYSVVEREPPEVMARNLRIAAHLWSSATAFFFAAFLFAYFYLRALDSSAVWRPKHVDPSFALGTLAAVALVAAAVLLQLAVLDHRGARRVPAARIKSAGALLLLLVAVALQIVEWSTQGFGPTNGPYASVYLGWTGLLALFLVGLAFWVETTLATSIRYRNVDRGLLPEGHASGDAGRTAPDIESPLSLIQPELESVSFYATFLAGIGLVSWFILYVI